LRPGTTVSVQMIAHSFNDALVIPASALLKPPDGGTSVMVVGADGRAHRVSVETGVRQGDRLQVIKGLNGGEKVVNNGAYGLPDNTRVKIAETTVPADVNQSAAGPEKTATGRKD
jgi:HlyD family secretion protein